MLSVHKKIPLSVLILLLFAAAGVTAYLSGGPFGIFGHSSGEIEKDFQFVTQDCSSNPSGGNPYKFCEATCPNGYYAVNGSCLTKPAFNGFGGYLTGLQYTLMGVLPESGLRSYSCFNNELQDDPTNFLTTTATCMQSGGVSLPETAECGNYRIDTGEVCDKENLGDWLDCTDFKSSDDKPLCNGTLSCTNSCGAFDVANCEYCDIDVCGPGLSYCSDGSCHPDCAAAGLGDGSARVGSGTCPTPGTCPTVPPYPGPGGTICGNALKEGSEACDPPGSTGICARIVCPDGTSVCQYQICVACQWEWQGNPCGSGCLMPCQSHASCGPGLTCELGCCVPWNI